MLKAQSQQAEPLDWAMVNAVFNTIGVGLEPGIQHLLGNELSFEEFENWIIQNGDISDEMIAHFNQVVSGKIDWMDEENSYDILSENDWKNWNDNGFVIIRNAISKNQAEQTAQLVYNSIGATADDKDSWYKPHALKQGIMVQLFNHPLLSKNRFNSKIKRAFQEILGRKDLLVSRDRVSFNPPETAEHKFPGPHLHWDVSLKRPIPFGVQGLLYLTDTLAEQGAFCAVTGFHKKIDNWLESLKEGDNPREIAKTQFQATPIGANAGDLIIWNQCLPHGSAPNTSTKPRLVQYISYQPIHLEHHREWI